MWFIGVEVEQETSAPPPKKNPGSAPAVSDRILFTVSLVTSGGPLWWSITKAFLSSGN